METNKGTGPEKKFKAGAVSATVWKNTGQNKQGENFEVKSISLERAYKDATGSWKYTTSFRLNDLPRATLVLTEAYKYLTTSQFNNNEANI